MGAPRICGTACSGESCLLDIEEVCDLAVKPCGPEIDLMGIFNMKENDTY